MSWTFSTTPGWSAHVAAVPTGDRAAAWYEVAVPELAATGQGKVPTPCVVVAHVETPRLVGPKGLAKRLMDALHDQRPTGTKHSHGAPLAGDHPGSVAGLAVEVCVGSQPRVRYTLGRELHVAAGNPIARVQVDLDCPNDVGASSAENARLKAARASFAEATAAAWDDAAPVDANGVALLIRHARGRDEDNTWEGWLRAITPFLGTVPHAVASVADPALAAGVVYEVFAAEKRTPSPLPRFAAPSASREAHFEPITTAEQFADAVRGRGFIVISDSAGPNRVHHPSCRYVTIESFRAKVLDALPAGRTPNGRYYLAPSIEVARANRAIECGHCLG